MVSLYSMLILIFIVAFLFCRGILGCICFIFVQEVDKFMCMDLKIWVWHHSGPFCFYFIITILNVFSKIQCCGYFLLCNKIFKPYGRLSSFRVHMEWNVTGWDMGIMFHTRPSQPCYGLFLYTEGCYRIYLRQQE